MTQCFPDIDGIFWQSLFSLLYGREHYYASSEIVQNLQKQVKKKQKQVIEAFLIRTCKLRQSSNIQQHIKPKLPNVTECMSNP